MLKAMQYLHFTVPKVPKDAKILLLLQKKKKSYFVC